MKKDIWIMGIETIFGCWGIHAGMVLREISRFDREMKLLKQSEKVPRPR